MSQVSEASTHEDTPGLPAVRDEAAQTPWWVPVLGLVLGLVVVAFVVWRAQTNVTTPAAHESGEGVSGRGEP